MKNLVSFALYYLLLLCSFYFILIGYPLWDGFFYWVWKSIRNHTIQYGYLLFLLIEIVFTTLPLLFYTRKDLDNKVDKSSEIALIIPCHRAEKIIQKTLEHALKVFSCDSIYVVDNGSSETPLDNTRQICEEMGVNYTWVPVGGKEYAIYVGAKITKTYKYVMQIDDDVFLNDDMSFPIKDDTACIAYMISAINSQGKKTLLHDIQDHEYKHSGIIKGVQSRFGSTMFAHGAISLWNREILINVMENHPMYRISDDWFTGYVLNSMGKRVDVCDRNFVETDVPENIFEMFKSSRTSGYGNATLFSQRFNRWYKTRGIQLFYILYYILFNWKQEFKVAIVQKIFLLWDMMNSILSFSKYWIMTFYAIINVQFTFIMYGACVASGMVGFLIFNYYQLKENERLPLYMIIINPLYNLYDTYVFFGSVIYSMFYNPFILFNKKEKFTDNQKIQEILRRYEC